MIEISIEHNPEKWLEMWFKEKKIVIKPGDVVEMNGVIKHIDDVIAKMNCDFTTFRPEKTRITLPVLRNAFGLKISEMNEIAKQKAVAKLKFKPDGNRNIEKFVRALIGHGDEIVEAVLKHFLWQMKRNMFGLEVLDHMMPFVYGATQRQGKSSAIKKLLSPIDSLWCNAKLSDLNDERKSKMFFNNYAGLLDEIQNSTKIEMERVKERITTQSITFRPLYSNNIVQLKNNCSLIAVSNKPLAFVLHDHTGMRRFYEIEVTKQLNWTLINSIDYLALWQGIDENRSTPYIEPYREQIEAHQEVSRDKCSVEQWIEEFNITVGDFKNILNDTYHHYVNFCKSSGVYPDSKRIFGMKLKDFLQIISKPMHGARCYFLNQFLNGIQKEHFDTDTNEP